MIKKIALIGNQNCGKTTLFNALTGSSQHVGNFPGVTVEQKTGFIKKHKDELELIDLPGIYSLSPYTSEEIVSIRYLLEEKPCLIINIIDATNMERNLYLTTQLLELNIPMILVLNMMDEVIVSGNSIDIDASAFRLKDMHCEMFQPENILQENQFPKLLTAKVLDFLTKEAKVTVDEQ